jgi:hypothetical protein
VETALQMQQSGEGFKLIQPSIKKLEQKWSVRKFSFVFLGISFENAKNGGIATKML